MKDDIEPRLRFAISYARMAINYLNSIPSTEGDAQREHAIASFNEAIGHVQQYGQEADVEIRERMKT